jgi:aspartyl-tRNA(Asn)/glutamyl-tRNA(Gln) amidotransferase subunit A
MDRARRAVGVTALADLTVSELLDAYRSRAATPLEAVESCLRRCLRLDRTIGAVLALEADHAMEAAAESTRRWDRREPRALEGIPYGLKDIICTAGVRTTGGSELFADHVPRGSATVDERLIEAGAVRLAKLQTYEFACGSNAVTRNPWQLERWASGSSSGSAAAVAARELPLAIGTDTGGSIAIPAALCGITGLKPTFGRVPRHGVMALSWTLDHVGPMTRSAYDAALALQVLAGHDPRDPTSSRRPVEEYVADISSDIAGLRIGVPRDWFFDVCHPEIEAATRRAIDLLATERMDVQEIALPATETADPHALELMIIYGELASLHGADDRRRKYGPEFEKLLVRAQFTSAADYLHALRARHLVQLDFERAFEAVDVLVVPAVIYRTPRTDRLVADVGGAELPLADVVARTTAIFNIVGVPTVTVPGGFGADGMPIGIQFATRPHAEAVCLRIAHAFQQLTDHHLQVPRAVAHENGATGKAVAALPSETLYYPVVTATEDGLW